MKKGLIITITIAIALIGIKTSQNKRNDLVEQYVGCLQNSHVQRDYCAKTLNSDYHYLDELLKEKGYTYKQVGKDLIISENR